MSRKIGDHITFEFKGETKEGFILDVDQWELLIKKELSLPYLVETKGGATYWVGEQMIKEGQPHE